MFIFSRLNEQMHIDCSQSSRIIAEWGRRDNSPGSSAIYNVCVSPSCLRELLYDYALLVLWSYNYFCNYYLYNFYALRISLRSWSTCQELKTFAYYFVFIRTIKTISNTQLYARMYLFMQCIGFKVIVMQL